MSRVTLGLLLVLVVAWAGCAKPNEREAVAGDISLKGQPLDQGTIMFHPLDGQDSYSGAQIDQGKYAIDKKQGLLPGKYKVQITSGDPKNIAPPEELPGAPRPVFKERIPKAYSTESKQTIDVKKGGPNKFDFHIP
jgi:hypothetical protein